MANTAVIYKSQYGSTRKYAMHIASSLKADIYDLDRVKKFEFDKYDTIIFGGGLYAGKIKGIGFLASNVSRLAGKNLIVFTTGIGDPGTASAAQQISKSLGKALPKELMKSVHLYCFRGGIDYGKLSLIHRIMMSMLHSMLAKKKEEELSKDDRDILDAYGSAVDYTNLSSASPLIEYVNIISR